MKTECLREPTVRGSHFFLIMFLLIMFLFMVVSAALVFGSPVALRAETASAPDFLKEKAFLERLDEPFVLSRDLTRLREILERIEDDSRVSILIDRRLNPRKLLPVSLQAAYLDDAIRDLVLPVGTISVLADTIYVGPERTAMTLKTRAHFSLKQLDTVIARNLKRKGELIRRHPVSWDDGATPRQILESIGQRYQIQFENLDLIPHDQWQAGTIVSATAIEALAMISTQFGLDVSWKSADLVEFVPEVPSPRLQIEHTVKGQTPASAKALVEQRLAGASTDITVEIRRTKLAVVATLENHEQISRLLGNIPSRKPPTDPRLAPLELRRFSLKMQAIPFSTLLNSLNDQGIAVQYDESEWKAAGRDLDQKLTFEVNDVTLQELLEKCREQVAFRYRLQGLRLELHP